MSENGQTGPAAATAEGTTAPEVPLLEVSDLKTYYEVRRGLTERATRVPKQWVHAVDGVSFRVARGEMMALVGESGCGKTTTAQTILGMVRPTSGAVRLSGTDIARLSERQLRPLRRTVQMIYQDPYESLDPRFRVRESVGTVCPKMGAWGFGHTIRSWDLKTRFFRLPPWRSISMTPGHYMWRKS